MKLHIPKWLLILIGATGVLVATAQILLVRVFSDAPHQISREVSLPADFVLKIEGQTIRVSLERAFFASSHGGLHGDGTAVTAYRIATEDISTLVDAMKQNTPQFTWGERAARTTSFSHFEKLLPDSFRAAPDALLLHAQPGSGLLVTEYYIDQRRATLYVVSNTF